VIALSDIPARLVRIEEPALSAVVPARHPHEQALHAFVVGQLAPREQREAPSERPCFRNSRRSIERMSLGKCPARLVSSSFF